MLKAKLPQVVINIFIITYFIYFGNPNVLSQVPVNNPKLRADIRKKLKDEIPNKQELSLYNLKNLFDSNEYLKRERFNKIFDLLIVRRIEFDITPEIELSFIDYLLNRNIKLPAIKKFIKRLKFVNAEDNFSRLKGQFLEISKSTNLNDNQFLEKVTDVVELFLSSEDPDGVGKVYILRADIYYKLDNLDRAIDDLRKALVLGFNGRETNQLLGQCFEAKGNLEIPNSSQASIYFKDAIAYYSKAMRADSTNAVLFLYRGRLLNKVGDTINAEQDFKRYEELNNKKDF